MAPARALDPDHQSRSPDAKEHQTQGEDHEQHGSEKTASASGAITRMQPEATNLDRAESSQSSLEQSATPEDGTSPAPPANLPGTKPWDMMERLTEAMGEYLYVMIHMCIEVPYSSSGSTEERVIAKNLRLQRMVTLHKSDHYQNIHNQLKTGQQSLLYTDRRQHESSFWDAMDLVCYNKSLTADEKALSGVLFAFFFRAALITGFGEKKDSGTAKTARVFFLELEKLPAVVAKWYCIRWYLDCFDRWWVKRNPGRQRETEDYIREIGLWKPSDGPLEQESFGRLAPLSEKQCADIRRIVRCQVKKRAMKPHGDQPYRDLYMKPDTMFKPETGPVNIDALDAQYLAEAFGITDLVEVYPTLWDEDKYEKNLKSSRKGKPSWNIISPPQTVKESDDDGELQEVQDDSSEQDLDQPLTPQLEGLTLNSNEDRKDEEQRKLVAESE